MAVKNNREGAKPAKIKKRFVRYREGAELYSMSERKFMDLAKDAQATYKINQVIPDHRLTEVMDIELIGKIFLCKCQKMLANICSILYTVVRLNNKSDFFNHWIQIWEQAGYLYLRFFPIFM